MNIMIVGGGKVGYYLTKTLISEKHQITLIDSDEGMCQKVANELGDQNIQVFQGDGTDVDFMHDAEIEKANLFIAVTGDDENNLVACQLAKQYFAVPRTIARVNNPKNINIFKQLGVDSVVSSTALIADIIELEIDFASLNKLLALNIGNVRIKELVVHAHSSVINRQIKDLDLPQGSIIISVVRGQSIIVPDGQTVLEALDHVIVLTNENIFEQLKSIFR